MIIRHILSTVGMGSTAIKYASVLAICVMYATNVLHSQDTIATFRGIQLDTSSRLMRTITSENNYEERDSTIDAQSDTLLNELDVREGTPSDPAVVQPKVEYGAKDSSINDITGSRVHLYGEAFVRYEELEITSDYILFNFKTQEVEAFSRNGKIGKPVFKTGDQNVNADRIRYNIKSEKGLVHGARVLQNNLYVHGAVTKFIKAGADSLHIDDVVYNRNALITSCDADHPHWGIRTTKLKLIPDKIAIIGPANMELAGIPLPLVMPFAFAPLFDFSGGGTSGLIFPQDPIYRSPELGLGVRGLGYYFALSERLDLSARAELYTRGSWGLTLNSNYRQRYKHSGSINLAISRQLRESLGQLQPSVDNSYSITINHNQDPKAHPFRTIGGSLRFTVNDYDRRNFEVASAQLNSQINSNFNYSYRLSNKVNFNAGINHSQNTQTGSISFTLPQVQLRMNRIFPFKPSKGSVNQQKWYEKINVQYDGKFQNAVTTGDSILFSSETLGLFRSGFTHRMETASSYNLFEHVTFNVNANHDEFWYLHTTDYELDEDGRPLPVAKTGFKTLRESSIGVNLATNIFGTVQMSKGRLRGLRHQMTPSVGISYRPSNSGNSQEFVYASPTTGLDTSIIFNPFQSIRNTNLFNSRSLTDGGFSINYGIANTFEGKMFSKRDSTEKKFKIFNSVNLGGSYNLNADSLNWSPVSLTANAQILKNLGTLSINGAMDVYDVNERGQRINKTLISQGKGLVRFSSFTTNFSTTFTLKQIRDFFAGKNVGDVNYASNTDGRNVGFNEIREVADEEPLDAVIIEDDDREPEFFSWFADFRLSYNIRLNFNPASPTEQWQLSTHSIQLTSSMIKLTDKWGMQVGNLSYDIRDKRFVYPSFSLSRDLHCWQLSISWQPANQTYSFFIGVKAAPFSDFLKYQGGKSQFDSRRFR